MNLLKDKPNHITCNRSINKYHDYVDCNGKCKNKFHINCLNIEVTSFLEMKQTGEIKLWKCNTCEKELNVCESVMGGDHTQNINDISHWNLSSNR